MTRKSRARLREGTVHRQSPGWDEIIGLRSGSIFGTNTPLFEQRVVRSGPSGPHAALSGPKARTGKPRHTARRLLSGTGELSPCEKAKPVCGPLFGLGAAALTVVDRPVDAVGSDRLVQCFLIAYRGEEHRAVRRNRGALAAGGL